ncbi:RDD family protein [Caenimonas koreensis]|uniref:RDD family protein n=1 Tax=Caenimonas koreensis TaxID=367474 RepID=UPI001298D4F3
MTPTVLRRLASLLYEALVVVAVILVVVALYSFFTVAFPAMGLQRPALIALCFMALAGYFVYSWRHGQTLAMRAWRIRLADQFGNPPKLGQACLRFVLGWVWVVPPLAVVAAFHPYVNAFTSAITVSAVATAAWIIIWAYLAHLHPRKQFWHDALAGTRLIETEPAPKRT